MVEFPPIEHPRQAIHRGLNVERLVEPGERAVLFLDLSQRLLEPAIGFAQFPGAPRDLLFQLCVQAAQLLDHPSVLLVKRVPLHFQLSVVPKFLNGLGYFLQADRFGKKEINLHLVDGGNHRIHVVGPGENDFFGLGRDPANFLEKFHPGHARHHLVGDNHVRRALLKHPQRFLWLGRAAHLKLPAQQFGQGRQNFRLVVHQEHLRAPIGPFAFSPRGVGFSCHQPLRLNLGRLSFHGAFHLGRRLAPMPVRRQKFTGYFDWLNVSIRIPVEEKFSNTRVTLTP